MTIKVQMKKIRNKMINRMKKYREIKNDKLRIIKIKVKIQFKKMNQFRCKIIAKKMKKQIKINFKKIFSAFSW